MQNEAVATLRGQVADIVTGTVFLLIGFASCSIAAIRRRSGVRVLVWLGIWSAMYGARPLANSLITLGILPHWLQVCIPYMDTAFMYLTLVVAALAWMELTLDKVRIFLKAVVFTGLVIGVAGIVFFIFKGTKDNLIFYNQFLATCCLLALVVVAAIPRLSRKFLVMPDRGILFVGTLVFAMEGLYANLSSSMGLPSSPILGDLGFAVLLFSLGFVATRMIFANERRLLSIDNELSIAREIQTSIIPSRSPELSNLRIAAVYLPMTYVAGDFYDFIPVDQNRSGFLVADVSGHGVPAALIASMIKVAIRSVVPCAHDPREVLRGLNRVLSGQFRNQFVTASYLWVDTENCSVLYSAAGHPPLLLWREGKLERIESNGLLFGVIPDPDYPVRRLPIQPGDRFLLYTDGLTEPENSKGDSFGDSKLEEVIRKNQSCSPSDLAERLISELCLWQPASTQQDDITLVIVDVV